MIQPNFGRTKIIHYRTQSQLSCFPQLQISQKQIYMKLNEHHLNPRTKHHQNRASQMSKSFSQKCHQTVQSNIQYDSNFENEQQMKTQTSLLYLNCKQATITNKSGFTQNINDNSKQQSKSNYKQQQQQMSQRNSFILTMIKNSQSLYLDRIIRKRKKVLDQNNVEQSLPYKQQFNSNKYLLKTKLQNNQDQNRQTQKNHSFACSKINLCDRSASKITKTQNSVNCV